MTETFTHDDIEAFLGKELGVNWRDEHQDMVNALTTLFKHVSTDGEHFTPRRSLQRK